VSVYKLLLLLAVIPLAFAGCDSGNQPSSYVGHYEGFLVGGPSANPFQKSVSADVQASDQTLTIKVQANSDSTVFSFSVNAVSQDQIEVSSSDSSTNYFPASLSMTKSTDTCFAASGNELCYNGNEITVSLADGTAQVSKLVLDKVNPTSVTTAPKPLETPQAFTLDQLLERAKTRNFNTEAEFESLVQAKLTAKVAYLNLAPHFNIGTVLDLWGFVTTAMLHAIGDLTAFMLPNRWYQAAALDNAAHAEFDSYRLVQASSINIVQGLAYSVVRDEQALRSLEKSRVDITAIRDELLANEHGGGPLQVGTSDDVTSVLLTLISSIESMRETVLEERRALSQAAGFINPQAISEVAPIDVPVFTGALPGTQKQYETLAQNRSLTLVQMDDLIQAAQNQKSARYTQWLDPAGDNQGSVGLGLVDYIAVGSAMVQQLYDKKDAAQATLLGTVDNTFTQSQQIADQYQLAVQSSNTAQARVDRLLLDFRTGINFEMSALVNALQTKTQSDMNQIDAQYAYITLQAQMDYQTFSGPYAPLLAEKPDIDKTP
jgi:hypothetical protein